MKYATWNLNSAGQERTERCVKLLKEYSPDIIGLLEISGKNAFMALQEYFPDYSFSIFENQQGGNKGICVGAKSSLNPFFTHRDEFRTQTTLRPGALLTITYKEELVSFLFIHLKAFDDPLSYGLRDDMHKHVSSLKNTLGKNYNFIVLGDFNNVGLNAPYNAISDIDGTQELEVVEKRLNRSRMTLSDKNKGVTWWSGSKRLQPANLDHVFISNHIKHSEVQVIGLDSQEWNKTYSDHALLVGELYIQEY